MKLLVIGDIHGRTHWKKAVNSHPNADQYLFIGDLVDSFNVKNEVMLANLLDIIQFKKDNDPRVSLLLGNHCWQYLFHDRGFRCSGYRPEIASHFHFIYKENIDLFDLVVQLDSHTLISHAGITNSWMKGFKDDIRRFTKDFSIENLVQVINQSITQGSQNILSRIAQVGYLRGGPRMMVGGPIWADRRELVKDGLDKFNQIVGHTPTSSGKVETEFAFGGEKLVFTDVGDAEIDPYIVEYHTLIK